MPPVEISMTTMGCEPAREFDEAVLSETLNSARLIAGIFVYAVRT